MLEITDLKSLQAPLKARYREEPEAAVVTLHANGAIGDGVTCSVETGKALVKAGLHPATGGSRGQYLLRRHAAPGAGRLCRGDAQRRRHLARPCRPRREGPGRRRPRLPRHARRRQEAPVGFREIRLGFDIDGDLTDEQRATLVRLTERYCVVLQTIRSAPPVAVTVA